MPPEVSETAKRVLEAGGLTVEQGIEELSLGEDGRLTVAMAKRLVQTMKATAEEQDPPQGSEGSAEMGDDPEDAELEKDPPEDPEWLYFHADPPPRVRAAIVRAIVAKGLKPRVLAWHIQGRRAFFLTPDGVEVSVELGG